MSTSKHIDVRPTAGAIGAEVHGIDIARGVSDAAFDEIHAAWLAHQVIFFRGPKFIGYIACTTRRQAVPGIANITAAIGRICGAR